MKRAVVHLDIHLTHDLRHIQWTYDCVIAEDGKGLIVNVVKGCGTVGFNWSAVHIPTACPCGIVCSHSKKMYGNRPVIRCYFNHCLS